MHIIAEMLKELVEYFMKCGFKNRDKDLRLDHIDSISCMRTSHKHCHISSQNQKKKK